MIKYIASAILIIAATSLQAQEKIKWQLDSCIAFAQKENIQINRSKLNMERVEQDELNAKASLLPSLNASASQGFNFGQSIDPFTNQFATERVQYGNYGASLSFDLFRGLSKYKEVKRSQSDYTVNKLETDRMINDISLNIATGYLQILFQQELLKVAQEQVAITQMQVNRVKQLFDAGQVANSDYLDIKAQLANDELTRVKAENELLLSYVNLVQLMQLPAEFQRNFDIEIPDLTAYDNMELLVTPGEVYNAALEIMPEVLRDKESIARNEMNLEVVKGNYWPSLSFTAFAGSGYSGRNYNDFNNPESGTKSWSDQFNDNLNYQTGLSLRIPIYNGLAVRTSSQKAEIAIREANYNLSETKNNLEQAIQKAYYDALAAKQKYFASITAVESLTEAFAYSQLQYEEGVVDQVTYNQVKTNLTKAQSDLVQAKFDYIFRLKILDFYQGKPLEL
jgi:outer membrane protein